MKKAAIYLVLIMLSVVVAAPLPANAQSETTPAGVVTGMVVNQSQDSVVAESLEVMLHMWTKANEDLGMLHGQTETDGTFSFAGVELLPERVYAVMTTYNDVVYFSDPFSPAAGENEFDVDVPVFDTTSDLSAVTIDQMHILFEFAVDGMETTEIYLLSNRSNYTVKDSYTTETGQSGSLAFPLPPDADFVFYKPEEENRFVRIPGGFLDTAAMLPGERSGQFMVNYLVPYFESRSYTLTAPVNITAINLFIPQDAGVTLQGAGVAGPRTTNFEDGSVYLVYSVSGITKGQSLILTFDGKPKLASSAKVNPTNLPIILGALFIGLSMVGLGVWWWRRSDETEEDEETGSDFEVEDASLESVIAEIARLDEAHQKGELEEQEYSNRRAQLRDLARSLLDQEKQ